MCSYVFNRIGSVDKCPGCTETFTVGQTVEFENGMTYHKICLDAKNEAAAKEKK